MYDTLKDRFFEIYENLRLDRMRKSETIPSTPTTTGCEEFLRRNWEEIG